MEFRETQGIGVRRRLRSLSWRCSVLDVRRRRTASEGVGSNGRKWVVTARLLGVSMLRFADVDQPGKLPGTDRIDLGPGGRQIYRLWCSMLGTLPIGAGYRTHV